MSINVLFFGSTADIVGTRAITIETPATTADLLTLLERDHPRLASAKLLISINQEYAAGDAAINDNDEVAIFTAVSGG